jgi:prepilin signal peptidase PulO-like enzyme (type II secretory pathway)
MVAFLFGAIVGSFLNVLILRTHTKRSLGGRSHCMTCGAQLHAQDLIPVISYLALLGRCRTCGARISPRYVFVEVATGGAFMYVAWLGLNPLLTALLGVFTALLIVVFVYDFEHLIIPDEYVGALVVVALMYVGAVAYHTHIFSLIELAAPVLTFAFLGGLWKVSGGRWIGLGDAKLSIPLALMVGLTLSFSLIVFAFWIGAAVSVSLLLFERILMRGKHRLRFFGLPLTMKTEVPFAPFLIASFILVFYAHLDVFILTDMALGALAH